MVRTRLSPHLPLSVFLVVQSTLSLSVSGATISLDPFLSPHLPSLEHAPRAIPVPEDRRVATQGRRFASLPPEAPQGEDLLKLALRSTGPPVQPDPHPATDATMVVSANGSSAPRWRARLDYFHGGNAGTDGIIDGDFSLTGQNGLALSLGYVAIADLGSLPLDLLFQGALMWHNEKGSQPDFFQYTGSIKFEWKAFPWNHHLRSRFGFATGVSYASRIPHAEQVSRGGEPSRNLLHYLEPSLSLNAGDLCRLIRLHHLFGGFDSARLDNTWLVGSIFHRSGAWGLYGENDDGDPVSDGSNYYALGVQVEF